MKNITTPTGIDFNVAGVAIQSANLIASFMENINYNKRPKKILTATEFDFNKTVQ